MPFFGEFLINEREITRRQLDEALDCAVRVNLRIGRLAVNAGLMTGAQVKEVLRTARLKKDFFGATAIELGFLTPEQTSELLIMQADTRLPLGRALVRLGHLELGALEPLLERFHALVGEQHDANSPLEDRWANNAMLNAVLEQLPIVSLRLARIQLRAKHCPEWIPDPSYSVRVSMEINSEDNTVFGLAASDDLANSIARGVSWTDPNELTDIEVEEAVATFLTSIVDAAVAQLRDKGHEIDHGPADFAAWPLTGCPISVSTPHGQGVLIAAEQ